jgi:hypothetical protein
MKNTLMLKCAMDYFIEVYNNLFIELIVFWDLGFGSKLSDQPEFEF